jgi:hypothetical protein
MTQPEARLSAAIIKALRARFPGCYLVKNHGSPYSRRGRPDIEGCIDGFFVAIETKMPGKEPEAIQLHEHELIRRAGGFVIVAHSVEKAVYGVEDALATRRA